MSMKKKFFRTALTAITILALSVTSTTIYPNAAETKTPKLKVQIQFVDKNNHITTKNVDLKMSSAKKGSNKSGVVTESQAVYLEYNPKTNAVSLSSNKPVQSKSTTTQSEQNVWWKGTVSCTYKANGTYATYQNASGTWTQLRGNTTLKNRKVYYACTLGISYYSGTKYPTSNSFSYNTGFPKKKYGASSILGCNSTADIYSGGTKYGSIYVNCCVTF